MILDTQISPKMLIDTHIESIDYCYALLELLTAPMFVIYGLNIKCGYSVAARPVEV